MVTPKTSFLNRARIKCPDIPTIPLYLYCQLLIFCDTTDIFGTSVGNIVI